MARIYKGSHGLINLDLVAGVFLKIDGGYKVLAKTSEFKVMIIESGLGEMKAREKLEEIYKLWTEEKG